MKLAISIEKKKSSMIERTKNHNLRAHKTKSQLPQEHWLTKEGRHPIIQWRDELIEKANGLKVRKDNVVAIEFTFQVGEQMHWRDMPTPENRFGAKKAGNAEKMKALIKGARKAIENEFGAENIVSMELHTDESSPHIHAVVIPLKDGKLQAKHWIGGASKVGSIWSRMHKCVNEFLPCTYTPKSGKGGQKHDASKAAGGVNDPKKAQNVFMSLYDKMKEKSNLKELVEWMKAKIEQLEKELSKAFSKIKSLETKAEKQAKELKDAKALQARAEENERRREQQNKEYKARIEALETALAEKEHMARLELESKRDGSGSMSLRELARRAGSNGPKMG